MSDIERADVWRVQAEAAISRGDDPDIDAAAQEREDHATTRVATSEVYEAWFRDELLPMHEETWRLALRSLVQYGHPVRCTGSSYSKYELSTGTLGIGGSRHVGARGMDAMTTGLRLHIVDDGAITFGLRRAIAKSQEDPHDNKRLRHAVDKLDEAARSSGLIKAEAMTVSTSRDRLNPMTRETLKEVEYPRTWRQRLHNIHDEKSKQLVKEVMQTPDIDLHYDPLNVFLYVDGGYYAQRTHMSHCMRLGVPKLFTPESLKHASGHDELEKVQQVARQEVDAIATLGSMLIAVERPLRDTVAFQPRH